jgi:CheY-like chemotaxis protein
MASPKRILVVDDNLTLRVLLSQALEAAGYVAIAAESGEAALEVLRFDPPDLCVVDHHMPGMDGSELILAMRRSDDERVRSIPAIGLTGYDEAAQSLVDAGAFVALRKPCGEGPLLEHVAGALRQSALQAASRSSGGFTAAKARHSARS